MSDPGAIPGDGAQDGDQDHRPADRALIAARRGDHNRLGLATQRATVHFLGNFLADPAEVPPGAAIRLAAPIGVADVSCLARYRAGETRWDHAEAIKRRYG